MAEIVNLRRARKARARTEKENLAEASRAAHGIAGKTHKLAKANARKAARTLEGHKLEPDS